MSSILVPWWAIPAVIEGIVVILCVLFFDAELPFGELAAVSMFIIGTILALLCLVGCYLVAA